MAKWYGNVGFADTVEYAPGCWESQVVPKPYFGDLISSRWIRQNSEGTNDDINLSNQISIVADPYAEEHCASIVYVEFRGTKWKVANIDVQYPRLILSVGGVWNGE